MKIKSVAVLGAGAVGSYVIWGLSEKKDIRLGVIASGERAKRLKNKGCKINDTVYHPEVWTPEAAHDVDFLIVSLKYGALPRALDDITAVTGENTVIMSLMRRGQRGDHRGKSRCGASASCCYQSSFS